MSLHQLGIAHFPVLNRKFLSPTTSTFSDSVTSQDLIEDNKDVLLERLNDLVLRLSKEDSLEDSAVTAIHSEVDRIEKHIRAGRRKRLDEVAARENASYWGPLSPTRSVRMRLPNSPGSSPRQSILRESSSQMTASSAAELAKVAEELASQLTATVAELQTRKEESDHIHDLLVTRAEKAAERILLLEYRIAEMEDDFEANQSELKFLRIQLQAIEAQCSPYIPQNEDQELSESIMNWKIDWEDINRRSRARRKNCQSGTPLSDTESSEMPPRREYSQVSIQDVV